MANTKWIPDSWEVCEHPLEPHIEPGSTKLIIGTFPTRQVNYRNTFKFYYAGEQNRFWEVITEVFKPDFKNFKGEEAVRERKDFFSKNKIGITDMVRKCWRRNDSSLDENLYPIILTDVFKILREVSSINTLVLTSRTKVLGALGLLETYFIQQGLILGAIEKGIDRIWKTKFDFEGRSIKVLIPYSTSPTNTHGTMPKLIEMYKTCFKE